MNVDEILQVLEKRVEKGKLDQEHYRAIAALLRSGIVRHRSWGDGTIRKANAHTMHMYIDFEHKKNHHLDLIFATEILTPVELSSVAHKVSFTIGELPWHLLPSGDVAIGTIRTFLQNSARKGSLERRWDDSRLDFLLRLLPVYVYIGKQEFDGYLAFQYLEVVGAILENPFEGNALYVFGEDWQELCRLSKSELFSNRAGQFHRIVHAGDWEGRVRAFLRKDEKESGLEFRAR